jgi:FAD/FMN-containing dehydrogenase
MKVLQRREVLRGIAGFAVSAPALLRGPPARAELPALPNIAANDALLVPAPAAGADKYRPYNLRTRQQPQLRALCKTPRAVAAMVGWARDNHVPFALRAGGHSYEGLSESGSVVIDTRLMQGVNINGAGRTVTVGAGAQLGDIYQAVAARGLALPAGSCPTVGVTGHTLGGGFGHLARAFGLACDSLDWVELADPQGRLVTADSGNNADLFWACRGGGGGAFGAVTRLRFRLHPLTRVFIFGITWTVAANVAVKLIQAWQAWAPQAPDGISSFLRLRTSGAQRIEVHCAGQSTGTERQLRRELLHLLTVASPGTALRVSEKSFISAIHYYAAGTDDPTYLKGKSDYATAPLGDDGIVALIQGLQQIPDNAIAVICDAYGGAVARTGAGDTAFAHRAGTLFAMQYVATWDNAADTPMRLAQMRALYDLMRPYVSGGAYVGYCDLDLAHWAEAYWGANLPRLRAVKSAFDPDNVFAHAQSVR